jgi:pyrimidine operon attenuation protein/uracil phosphoribosyltransferase
LVLYSAQDISAMLETMTAGVIEACAGQYPSLVGIRTGGAYLALRLAARMTASLKRRIPCGLLDINLYRDDWSMRRPAPELRRTEIDFDLQDRHVLLVDDVLYTGRTVRAALDAILDLGRPRKIELAVLVDRGGRELPIAPDYVGAKVDIPASGRVDVLLSEEGHEDTVRLESG